MMHKHVDLNHYFKTHPISNEEFDKLAKQADKHGAKMIDYMTGLGFDVPHFHVNKHGQITDWDKLPPSVKYWLMDR